MRKIALLLMIVLALLSLGLLIYGLSHGEASVVAQNAKAFCFS